MSLRNRATPATYTLTDPLAELERTDPAVSMAAANLDRVKHDLLHAFKAAPSVVATTLAPLNEAGTEWRDFPRGNRNYAYLRERHEALTCALTQPCVVRWEAPAVLVSTANLRGASRQAAMAKAAGVKAKRELGGRIGEKFKDEIILALFGGSPFVTIVLTRIAPRSLDSDNLESAAKALRDGIAEALGIDDRDRRVRYVPNQEQGAPRQHAVRAELFIQPKSEAP